MDTVPPTTRERILTTTATLLTRQGYAASGLQEIAAHADARIGSIYHYFRDKETLAAESIRASGPTFAAVVLDALQAGPADPVQALGFAFDRAAADLVASDYADACPVATVALEVASTNEVLRGVTAEVFAGWIDGLTVWCHQIVDDPASARDLATAVLTSLEGAFILARSAREPEPLHAAGRSMVRLASAMRGADV